MAKGTFNILPTVERLTTVTVRTLQGLEAHRPEFIRLPRSGTRDPLTGLSRTTLRSLIDGPNPPVKSVLLRKRNALHGARLIEVDSLLSHIRSMGITTEKTGDKEYKSSPTSGSREMRAPIFPKKNGR